MTLLSPVQLAHLRIDSPPMLTSGSSSLQVLGRIAKNNQAGTSTCGTFPVPASGQTCLLSKAGPTSAIPVLLPVATLPQPLSGHGTLPFITLLRVSPEGGGSWWASKSGQRSLGRTQVLPCPCGLCWHSGDQRRPVLCSGILASSPESGDQMSCMSAEPNSVSGTPCPLVLHTLPRAAVGQLWSWERRAFIAPRPSKRGVAGGLAWRRPFNCVLPHPIPQSLQYCGARSSTDKEAEAHIG